VYSSVDGGENKAMDTITKGSREVWHIAKSVAMWTWRRFDLEASDKRFSLRQAYRGAMGGRAKGAVNEDKRASARLMRVAGRSIREIAAALSVGKSTVADWVSG
jgi:DNA invertase Pin-like site-specific DNA recombinase